MKALHTTLFALLFICSTFISNAQSTASEAGTTPGALSVSLTGAATYSVPIDVPPGVKEIAPSIALTYSSQGGNGLAGWGWSISGLSTITRIASTKYHDNVIDPIDFDSNDRFALDGQRLVLKSGTYGKNGTVYQTENYSNIKVISYGTSPYGSSYGPSYFIVFYPDGSRAWYGNAGGSRSRLEWAIYKWQDPQNNFIQYSYSQSNNLLRVTKISYGSRSGTSAPYSMNFIYKTRFRPESSYVAGQFFKRAHLLDRVEVKYSSILYRKYQLGYHPGSNELAYQTLGYIQEYDGNNKTLEPIKFEYDKSAQGGSVNQIANFFSNSALGINSENYNTLSGDFNGDGRIDLLAYHRTQKNQLKIFKNLHDGNQSNIASVINTGRFDELVSGSILSNINSILPNQGIGVISESSSTSSSTSTVSFKVYNDRALEYTKTWRAPTYRSDSYTCNAKYYYKIPKRYVSGDFNGDGLMDVIAVTRRYNERHCIKKRGDCGGGPGDDPIFAEAKKENQVNKSSSRSSSCCECNNYTRSTAKSYFIDLNRQKTSNYTNYSGGLQAELKSSDRLVSADFDGDGKTDLFHITEGKIYVYSLDSSNILRRIAYTTSSGIKMANPPLIADFNGDGKTDVVFPVAEFKEDWHFFLSKGNSFLSYIQDINVLYRKTKGYTAYIDEQYFVAQDFNGDGKADILNHRLATAQPRYNFSESESLRLYINLGNDRPLFLKSVDKTYQNPGKKRYGIPVFLDAKYGNNNLEYAYISDKKITAWEFTLDNRVDMCLKKITNNGVTSTLLYDRLVKTSSGGYSGSTYKPDYSQRYPYININESPNFLVVKQIKEQGSGLTRYKDYAYEGAVGHATGLGFLGFTVFHQSNWYGNGVTRLWNSSRYDLKNKGVVEQEWKANHKSSLPSNYIIKTNYEYSHSVNGRKEIWTFPSEKTTHYKLEGHYEYVNYDYDTYRNVTKTTTTKDNNSIIVTYVYSNNSSSTSQYYHIGRPKKKIVRSTINGNSFNEENEYFYSNNLLTSSRKRGSGTPWLTESYLHDAWGNVTRKEISAPNMPKRYERFTYASGRFLNSQTDVEGLKTTYLVDNKNGNILRVTNPYGLQTNYEYDGWNRLKKETNYLNKSTYYTYRKGSNGNLEKVTNYNQGPDQVEVNNAFGWKTKVMTMSLNGKYIQIDTQYDVAGRVVKTSEPHFNNTSASQWNTTVFDEYGRVIEQRQFTGKVTNISYNGLNTTADDGTRTITTTKDASDNITKVVDNGGTVTYEYHGNGELKTTNFEGQKVVTEIDKWGRRTKLIDPSAGTYTYTYNLYGEVTKETTPKGETKYSYDSLGKITKKTIKGDETDLELDYSYNGDRLLSSIQGKDNKFGKYYNYNYYYRSSDKKLEKVIENNDLARFEKQTTFDSYGRPYRETYISSNKSNGTASTVKVRNIYDTHSGALEEILNDSNSARLWKVNSHDHRGQTTSVSLGNGYLETDTYDSYGYHKYSRAYKSGSSTTYAMSMNYTFDARRGILKNRKNNNMGWTENFTHDNLDRLTGISGPNSRSHSYYNNGTIRNNNKIGEYKYNSSKKYQLASIDLNTAGQNYFNGREQQHITYNAFKKPIDVYEEGNGKVSFEYGVMGNRSHAWYGGLDNEKEQRRYHKHYSAIIPVEIVEDKNTNSVKIITYVGGDGYTAPVADILLKNGNSGYKGYYYLHRDYLGSILAITGAGGNIVEQRQFGAWGTIDRFKKGSSYSSFDHTAILGRGYTGHEHFFEVGLIHMNGRMYDAQLGRFLSPDNFVQDPYNTQNFNRYGYVLNNPLVNADPSGELWQLLVGAAVSVLVNGINNVANGRGFFKGAFGAAIVGAWGGAFSLGIGNVANSIGTSIAPWLSCGAESVVRASFQVGAHGALGGLMTAMQGGNFGSGFLSGASSSLVASGIGKFLRRATPFWRATGTIAGGGVSGGVASSIAGGRFWDGLRNGIISSSLNHVVHQSVQAIRKIIGFYGAGTSLGIEGTQNEDLEDFIKSKGGKMFGHDNISVRKAARYLRRWSRWSKASSGGFSIEVYGYSRGGNAAVRLSHLLNHEQYAVVIDKLVLLDPQIVGFFGSHFKIPGNVSEVWSFYQYNERTFLKSISDPIGSNPFNGRPVRALSGSTTVHNINLSSTNITPTRPVTHNNIVSYVLGRYRF